MSIVISASSAWSTSLLLKIMIGRLMIEWPSLNLNEFRRGNAIVNYFPRNQASSAVICMHDHVDRFLRTIHC